VLCPLDDEGITHHVRFVHNLGTYESVACVSAIEERTQLEFRYVRCAEEEMGTCPTIIMKAKKSIP
jgi:hypothetical protein